MTSTVQATIEATLRDQADAVLAEIGVTMDDAVALFLHRVVEEHDLLFAMHPNAATREALAEFERGEYITCCSIEEMHALIDASE